MDEHAFLRNSINVSGMDPEEGDSVPSLLGTGANDSVGPVRRASQQDLNSISSTFAPKNKLPRQNTVKIISSFKSGSTANFGSNPNSHSPSPNNHKFNSYASQRTNKPNVPRLDTIGHKNSSYEGRSPTKSGAPGCCRHCCGTGNEVNKTEVVKTFNSEDAAPGDTKDAKLSGVKNGVFFYTNKASEVYKLSKVDA